MDKKRVGVVALLCMVVIMVSFALSKTYIDVKTENLAALTNIKALWPFSGTNNNNRALEVTRPVTGVPAGIFPPGLNAQEISDLTKAIIGDVTKMTCEELARYGSNMGKLVNITSPAEQAKQAAEHALSLLTPGTPAYTAQEAVLLAAHRTFNTLLRRRELLRATYDKECRDSTPVPVVAPVR